MTLSILQVGAFPFPTRNGSQVYLRSTARGLAQRGHRVAIACYHASDGAAPREVDLIRARRIPGASFLHSGPHWSRPLQDLALSRQIQRALDRRPIDVIHAHNAEGPLVARWARGSRSRPPIILDLHAVMERELPSWFPEQASLARFLGRVVDRAVLRSCDAAIAISEEGRDFLDESGVARVALIPPGVDLADLAGGKADRARKNWDLPDIPWVVYVGNSDPYQDLPDLLAAVAAVPNAGLLVVAPSDLSALGAEAHRAGIGPERRRFVESRVFADALDALAVASIGVLPRRVCPGFPVKLLNYLALGVPVVAAPGSARPIAGVVKAEGVHEISRMIAALLGDPDRRRSLGEAARAEVTSKWTNAVQAERLERFYLDVMQSTAEARAGG
jgi:glycosyltransferase involved in cell wall biosynthesis